MVAQGGRRQRARRRLGGEFGGTATQKNAETGATEGIGILVAALVLVITFGSLVAAGLPLLTALLGIGFDVSGRLSAALVPYLAIVVGLAREEYVASATAAGPRDMASVGGWRLTAFAIGDGGREDASVAALSIRDLDDAVSEKLCRRAARNGRSVEAEIRAILTAAVTEDPPRTDLSRTDLSRTDLSRTDLSRTDLFSALAGRFAELGGVDVDLPVHAAPSRAAVLPGR